jgi:hypothetical protein
MNRIKKLIVLADDFEKKIAAETKGEYGGKGPYILPAHHVAGIRVPKGGSSCANCKFGETREGSPHCKSAYWVVWNGGDSRLPVNDPETYCSDFWEPKE